MIVIIILIYKTFRTQKGVTIKFLKM